MKNRNRRHQLSRNENHSNPAEVAQRAYELYQARGGEPGHELDDWLQAEREIAQRGQIARRG